MTASARHRQTLAWRAGVVPLPAHASGLEETAERPIACPTVSERAGARAEAGFSGWEGLAVPDNAELIMRFHPVGGEDVSVLSKDFGGEKEALEQIAQLMDERHSLVLRRARYDREKAENGMVINLANVVSVRVSMKDTSTTGQYL
jgi:hypothetical protein